MRIGRKGNETANCGKASANGAPLDFSNCRFYYDNLLGIITYPMVYRMITSNGAKRRGHKLRLITV
jgi:hypothetical protein